MRRISKYERMINNGHFNEAVVTKLQSNGNFRAHVRQLVREAARMNYDEQDFTNDYYVSITFANNQFYAVVRSNTRDGRYFNDVEEFVINADQFDAEYSIREAEKVVLSNDVYEA